MNYLRPWNVLIIVFQGLILSNNQNGKIMIEKVLFYFDKTVSDDIKEKMNSLVTEFLKAGIVVIIQNNKLTDEKKEIKRLALVAKESKVSVIISFGLESYYKSIRAGRICKIPTILSMTNISEVFFDNRKNDKKKIKNLLYCLKKATGIIFETEYSKKLLANFIKANSVIIKSPVADRFINCEKRDNKKLIASMGSCESNKDYMILIKAFEEIVKDYPEYKLKIYGRKGADNTYYQLREYVESHGLLDKILFVDSKDIDIKELAEVEIFVYPLKEVDSFAYLLTAMSIGLPVVAAESSDAVKEIIDDGYNGLLCDLSDNKNMSIAIRKYLENPEKAAELSASALKIKDEVKPEFISQKWIQFINECI